MNLGEILNFCNAKLNKDQSGNTFSKQQLNAVLPVVNLEYMKKKIGLPEDYQLGAPISRQAWDITQMITQQLSHLKVKMGDGETQPLQIDQYGRAAKPSDFMYHSALIWKVVDKNDAQVPGFYYNSIEVLTDAEYAEIISDAIVRPSKKYPVAYYIGSKIQFDPIDLKWAIFEYLRKPVTPYFDCDVINDMMFYLPPGTTRKGESVTASATTTISNTTIVLNNATTEGLIVGSTVTGTGIPASTVISSIPTPSKIVLSNAATASGTVTVTINSANTASQSVELDWPEITHPDIANLIYVLMTQNLKDDRGYQQGKIRQTTGE